MWRDRLQIMRGLPTVFLCFLVIGCTMASSQRMFPTTSGPLASQEGADILGNVVCNLSPNSIATSGKNLLKQLSQCQSFTPDQVRAILAVLSSGDTPFGPPSEWSSLTLEELRGFFPLFDRTILEQIPRSVLLPWMKDSLHTSHLSREQLATVVENLKSSRRKRAAECSPEKTVTEKVVQDNTMPLAYTPEELRACLKGPILEKNLGILTDYAFTEEQLQVIKENLDEMFPNGYPESIVRNLGNLKNFMNLDDIKKWKFTSADTLVSLMEQQPDEKLAPAIIKQYIDSGGELNSQALNAIGSRYICLLNEDQLKQINEDTIKDINSLDLSKCSQITKDILYSKARTAFSDKQFPDYYLMIKPYLGGAPVEDLRALSRHNVNMDIKTFMGLRNDSVLELTTSEVKDLLGKNLGELKNEQDNFPIKDWIRKQRQSELNSLFPGLSGGIPEGYINITPRHNSPSDTSAAQHPATSIHILHAFAATLLLTSLLS